MSKRLISAILIAIFGVCVAALFASCEKNIAVTGITVGDTQISLTVGDSYELSYAVYPENATDKTVVYAISNPDLLAMDGDTVTALRSGTASVTITTNDGDYKAEITFIIAEKQYSATFVIDGEPIAALVFDSTTTTLAEPEIPEKVGYSAEWENYCLGDADIVINAVYTPITYYADFMADGVLVERVAYTVESEGISEPTIPNKTGFTAVWGKYSLTLGGILIDAEYAPITYIATFLFDGETVGEIPFTVNNSHISAPQMADRVGYNFKWDEFEIIADNFSVNGQYVAINYQINYVDELNAENLNPDSFTVTTDAIILRDLSASGYEFVGWYVGNKRVYVIDTAILEDVTVTARWELVKYSVIFTVNYQEYERVEYTVNDTTISLPEVPKKEGYVGSWEEFTLTYGDPVYVNPIYVPEDK